MGHFSVRAFIPSNRRGRAAKRASSKRSAILAMEPLEDRRLLSTAPHGGGGTLFDEHEAVLRLVDFPNIHDVAPGGAFTFKNNISLASEQGELRYWGANTFNTNNSWSPVYSVSAADFVSVSSVGMDGPRQADGSLPVTNFMRLAPTSGLVNRGVEVGIPFTGSAPDLGAFER